MEEHEQLCTTNDKPKGQLTNRGIKPKEDRHQRIGDSTVIMLRPSSASDKEERRLKRRRDFGDVSLYRCRSIASITGLEQVSKPHNLLPRYFSYNSHNLIGGLS